MSEYICIDGGILEGGGQILRMAIAFSALLKKSIRVVNIRAGRSKPGLRPQHLAGLELVRDVCNGKLTGGEIGSTEIRFCPGKIVSGKFFADPKTAGSIMLLFQVSFPCLLYAPEASELYLRGGTNAEMAPQIDHTLKVFKPIAERFGAKFECNIVKRGYFPKGGGEAVLKIFPVEKCLQPLSLLEVGDVIEIAGFSFVAGVLPIKMAHIMADSATRILRQPFAGIPLKIEKVKEPQHSAIGNGSGIVIVATTSTGCIFGGSALGKRELQAEEVGEMAARELLDDVRSGGCVDKFTQDQVIILMALAKGKSRMRCGKLTLHTETAIYVAEQLAEVKFNVTKEESSGQTIIECDGIGLERLCE